MVKLRWVDGSSMPRARPIEYSEWEYHKDTLIALYHTRSLNELMEIMRSECGFSPTRRQYVVQFGKWGLTKYQKSRIGLSKLPVFSESSSLNITPTSILLASDSSSEDLSSDASRKELQPSSHRRDLFDSGTIFARKRALTDDSGSTRSGHHEKRRNTHSGSETRGVRSTDPASFVEMGPAYHETPPLPTMASRTSRSRAASIESNSSWIDVKSGLEVWQAPTTAGLSTPPSSNQSSDTPKILPVRQIHSSETTTSEAGRMQSIIIPTKHTSFQQPGVSGAMVIDHPNVQRTPSQGSARSGILRWGSLMLPTRNSSRSTQPRKSDSFKSLQRSVIERLARNNSSGSNKSVLPSTVMGESDDSWDTVSVLSEDIAENLTLSEP